MSTPRRLYALCQDAVVAGALKSAASVPWDEPGPLEHAAGSVVEELMEVAASRRPASSTAAWSDDWRVFLTPSVTRALLAWDRQLLTTLRCQKLRRVLVVRAARGFDPRDLSWLPTSVASLDFDGELYHRGRRPPALDAPVLGERAWLPEAEELFRIENSANSLLIAASDAGDKLFAFSALHVMRSKPHPLDACALTELHLGTLRMTPAQLATILRSCPSLRLLRHYQLAAALYDMHAAQWRDAQPLPTYKLRNIDADFSHVVRLRMEPTPVLPPDALRLVVQLCPEASCARTRFDCETAHDALMPLRTLRRLRELSVVCVSSGQRTLLDFSDIRPVLEAHGADSLTALELKVIEEVDVHVIMTKCPRLERLVLSGCGHVTPPTCAAQRNRCATHLRMARLRLLFFADGDDFSWDHAPPQCFWRATLGGDAGPRRGELPHGRLEGLFLESPRLSNTTVTALSKVTQPALRVLSLCRCPEMRADLLSALCASPQLSHARVEQCAGVTQSELRAHVKRSGAQHVAVSWKP